MNKVNSQTSNQIRISYSPGKFRFNEEKQELAKAAATRKKKEANWFIKKDPQFGQFLTLCHKSDVTPTLKRLIAYMEYLGA